jgi:hypothetical protein
MCIAIPNRSVLYRGKGITDLGDIEYVHLTNEENGFINYVDK